MSRPPKPVTVIRMEGKSNRTKAELKAREREEKSLLTGESITENQSVKDNVRAHKHYIDIRRWLNKIEKNDAIYQNIINRYALMLAECEDLVEKRELFNQGIFKLDEAYENAEIEPIEYFETLVKMQQSVIACDKQVDAKRRIIFNIEKENLMTISAALRSIPKAAPEEIDDSGMGALLTRGRA